MSENFNPVYALSWLASYIDRGFMEVAPEKSQAFRTMPVEDFVEFWQDRHQPDEQLTAMFAACRREERVAAGWQALEGSRRLDASSRRRAWKGEGGASLQA